MRIKLDENLSMKLKAGLAELGHDTDTVRDEQRTGSPDKDVWAAAQADQRFLVTLDLDFSDVRQSRPARTPESSSYVCRKANSTARQNMSSAGSSDLTPASGPDAS